MVEFLARETPDFIRPKLLGPATVNHFSPLKQTKFTVKASQQLMTPVDTSKLVLTTHFMTSSFRHNSAEVSKKYLMKSENFVQIFWAGILSAILCKFIVTTSVSRTLTKSSTLKTTNKLIKCKNLVHSSYKSWLCVQIPNYSEHDNTKVYTQFNTLPQCFHVPWFLTVFGQISQISRYV